MYNLLAMNRLYQDGVSWFERVEHIALEHILITCGCQQVNGCGPRPCPSTLVPRGPCLRAFLHHRLGVRWIAGCVQHSTCPSAELGP